MWKRKNTRLLQNEFKVRDYSTIFLTYHNLTNIVRLIGVKLYRKLPERKWNLFRVFGRFALPRVRVTEGKITANVSKKSMGNWCWFENARVRVIWSQLYLLNYVRLFSSMSFSFFNECVMKMHSNGVVSSWDNITLLQCYKYEKRDSYWLRYFDSLLRVLFCIPLLLQCKSDKLVTWFQ